MLKVDMVLSLETKFYRPVEVTKIIDGGAEYCSRCGCHLAQPNGDCTLELKYNIPCEYIEKANELDSCTIIFEEVV